MSPPKLSEPPLSFKVFYTNLPPKFDQKELHPSPNKNLGIPFPLGMFLAASLRIKTQGNCPKILILPKTPILENYKLALRPCEDLDLVELVTG